MPNVNALKKFVKKKANSSNLANNVKVNAKEKINRLKIKQKTENATKGKVIQMPNQRRQNQEELYNFNVN